MLGITQDRNSTEMSHKVTSVWYCSSYSCVYCPVDVLLDYLQSREIHNCRNAFIVSEMDNGMINCWGKILSYSDGRCCQRITGLVVFKPTSEAVFLIGPDSQLFLVVGLFGQVCRFWKLASGIGRKLLVCYNRRNWSDSNRPSWRHAERKASRNVRCRSLLSAGDQ